MSYRAALVLAAALALAGCHRREITSLERKEAANVVSEADFAVNLRDWPRAEGLYVEGRRALPRPGGDLGEPGHSQDEDAQPRRRAVRVQVGAHGLFRRLRPRLHRFHGCPQEGLRAGASSVARTRPRSSWRKAYTKLPEDRRLRNFIEGKGLDKMIEDPSTKEISP